MEDLNLEKQKPSMPQDTHMIKPIFDKKTGAILFPYEKKYMKVNKNNVTQDVEYMHSLNRDRMQIKVKFTGEWFTGDKLSIEGENITYICVVKSSRKNKVIIRKIDEIKERTNYELTEEEKRITEKC